MHFQNFSKYFIASDCKFAGCPKCIFTSAPQLDLSWRADAHDGNCSFCSYDPILLHRSWQTNFLPRKPVVCNHPMSSTRLCHSFPTENWYHNIPSAPPQRPFVQMRACAPQFEQANNKPGKFLSIHLCTRTRWEFTSFVIFPKSSLTSTSPLPDSRRAGPDTCELGCHCLDNRRLFFPPSTPTNVIASCCDSPNGSKEMQPLMIPLAPGGLHVGFPLPAVSQEGISYCDCRRIVFSRSSLLPPREFLRRFPRKWCLSFEFNSHYTNNLD